EAHKSDGKQAHQGAPPRRQVNGRFGLCLWHGLRRGRSMFLSQRATQAEYCDRTDLPSSEVADNYRQLARFNRLLQVTDPFQRLLVRWLGRGQVKKLSMLDLGAGDGSIGRSIESWARHRGW